jgi:4-aminobutyrate aminotransferase
MEMHHPSIGEVRGRGLMMAAEFVSNRETKVRAAELRNHIIQNAFAKGLLLLPCGSNTIRFIPPLNISRELVEEGLHILDSAITEAERKFLK